MKFKPFTQKIQITKARNFEKMAGDEAFLMTSLVLILAVFLRRRRRFFDRMRLMSRQMERICDATDFGNPGNQQQNIRNRRKHKTMWVYPRPQF